MKHHSMLETGRRAAAALLLALGGTQALAAEPSVVWVDNESFGFASCGPLDALPGSQDPKELMSALRERGMIDASQMVRGLGMAQATVTLTPVSGAMRCEDAMSSMVFRVASHDPASGRSWTGNLVSRLPAQNLQSSGLHSTR